MDFKGASCGDIRAYFPKTNTKEVEIVKCKSVVELSPFVVKTDSDRSDVPDWAI